MVANLDRLSPGSGADWVRFIDRASKTWAASRRPFLESALDGPRSLITRETRPRDLFAVSPWLTLRRLARRHFDDPRLVTFVDRYATYTGSDPRKAPAALAVVPYVEQTFGAWYVDGGLHLLGQAIADRAVEQGARILLDTAVTAISMSGNRVDGVVLADGSTVPADIV